MRVSTDPDYMNARTKNLAIYERERDLSLQRKERGEYKEGEFERDRDAQRHAYAIAMSRAYADFLEREARELASASAA